MPKKRVQFDIEDDNEEEQEEESKLPFNKKFKHTLDSDEDDDEVENEKNYEFNPELFDGEEEGNLHNEGEVAITPFNIKEELKEGHFDTEGTFIFNKDKDEIKDNWVDNIDWAKIKEVEEKDDRKSVDSESDEDEKKANLEDCLKGLIDLMQPNETVQKAMQRLGKSKLKNKNKQKVKKDDKTETSKQDEEEEKERKIKLNSLIELSNQLLNDGDMNIYETKYETLKYQLAEHLRKKELDKKVSEEGKESGDYKAGTSFDIFGD